MRLAVVSVVCLTLLSISASSDTRRIDKETANRLQCAGKFAAAAEDVEYNGKSLGLLFKQYATDLAAPELSPTEDGVAGYQKEHEAFFRTGKRIAIVALQKEIRASEAGSTGTSGQRFGGTQILLAQLKLCESRFLGGNSL